MKKRLAGLLALCLAGGVAAKIFLSHNAPPAAGGNGNAHRRPAAGERQTRRPAGGRASGRDRRPERTQIAGNDNFFGEEDRSEK